MSEKISSLPNSIAPPHSIRHTLGWADDEEEEENEREMKVG